MGFGTSLFCELYFNKETFERKDQVEERIEELNTYIKGMETKLMGLGMMTEPNKFFKTEDEDGSIMDHVEFEVRNAIEELEDACIERYRLNMLLDNWKECHTSDGKAISPKFDCRKYSAFLSGDFVSSDEEEKTND